MHPVLTYCIQVHKSALELINNSSKPGCVELELKVISFPINPKVWSNSPTSQASIPVNEVLETDHHSFNACLEK